MRRSLAHWACVDVGRVHNRMMRDASADNNTKEHILQEPIKVASGLVAVSGAFNLFVHFNNDGPQSPRLFPRTPLDLTWPMSAQALEKLHKAMALVRMARSNEVLMFVEQVN